MPSLLDFFARQEGKALPPHPALRNNGTPIEILDLNSPSDRRRGPFAQAEAARHTNAYGGKQDAIDHVMNCVRLYADAAANAEWHLERDGKKLRRPEDDATEGAIGPIALYNLLDRPNPYQDYEELISLMVIDLLLVGNAYWYKWRSNEAGQPLALFRMSPQHIKIVPGDLGPKGYEYMVPESGQRKPLKMNLDEVVHFKLPNPHDPYYGLGIIQGGSRPMDMELALTEHMENYYRMGTNPSIVISSDRRIPKDIFKRVRNMLRGRYAGARNAGEMMILEAGLKADTLSPDATKAQLATISTLSRERIHAMFRVHPKLLGIPSQDGSDKADDAQRIFDHNVLQPFFNVAAKRITRALTQSYDVDFKIDHRYRLPKQDQVKLAGDFASIPGVTVKEVREFLDLPPTGDKEIDDLVLNLPGEEGMEGDTRNGFPDRNLPGEPGRPPRGENTRTIGQVGSGVRQVREARVRSRRPSEGKAFDDIVADLIALEGKASTVRLEEPQEPTPIQPPDDPFGTKRGDELDSIVAELTRELQNAGTTLERALLDHVEGKAFNSKNLRSRLRQSEAWRIFSEKVEAAMLKAHKRGLSRASVMWGNAGRTPDDEIDYDAIAKGLVHRRGGLRSIIKTQRDRVAAKVGEALDAGGGQLESEAAVRDAIKVWSDTQSALIAESEAVVAFNEGTLTVAELTGAAEVYVQEEEDAPDQPCIEARGRVWPIEYAREHYLEHPRCRRAFLPL